MIFCFENFLKKQDVEYKCNMDISKASFMGIGGKANYAVFPDSEARLVKTVDFLSEHCIPFRVVGKMTNVLPPDANYDGVLVFTAKMSHYYVAENTVYAECGVPFSLLLNNIAEMGLGGFEELYGIPGSLGGMIYGNAGAYGKTVADALISARVYDYRKKKICTLEKDGMKFSYRTSIFKNSDMILLSAEMLFLKISDYSVKDKLRSIVARRKKEQPYGEKSLGSIFKRCGDIPVSFLIDKLGLKGFRIGGAEISKKHAGFIVNADNATSADVIGIIELIKQKVYSAYGILPKEEIEYL